MTQDIHTTQYHAHHATFDLPPQLKDKTMHIFTLNDDGPSEFSLVISHADVQAEEQLKEFSDRLIKEMEQALPKFQLKSMKERTLDHSPAIELSYSWRNGGIFMQQRQVIALVQGPSPDRPQALLVAATCLNAFDAWNDAFDKVLDSVKLRHPLGAAAAEDNSPPAAPLPVSEPMLPVIFALSVRRRMLRAFANEADACAQVDPFEVEVDAWDFFNADGHPLQARFIVANSNIIWRKPGAYVLETAQDGNALPLRDCLHLASVLENSHRAYSPDVPFASLAEVRAHLQCRSEAAAAADTPKEG